LKTTKDSPHSATLKSILSTDPTTTAISRKRGAKYYKLFLGYLKKGWRRVRMV